MPYRTEDSNKLAHSTVNEHITISLLMSRVDHDSYTSV